MAVALAATTVPGHVKANENPLIIRTDLKPKVVPVVESPPVVIQEVRHVEEIRPVLPSPKPVPQGYSGGYTQGSPYNRGGLQCTDYVYQQTGYRQSGNAGSWRANTSVAAVGEIIIFRSGQNGAGSAGHVGIVVGVSGSRITIRDANWGGVGYVHTVSDTGNYIRL